MNNILTIRTLLLVCILGVTSVMRAQKDDFTTWTKLKINHKIDSRFSVLGGLELRTKDDISMIDRWGLAVGGEYKACSFLKMDVGYELHHRNLGELDWKFRHRYYMGATVNFRYQWLAVSLRERFQQTFDRGNSQSRLRSRLKLAYAPSKGIVSPYFSVEIYQSLDDAPFWRAARMRYRPGVEIDLAKRWSLDAFYCYQYESPKGKHVIGVEVGYSF
ncbi:DUF2490 domain-containing protein [Bacteroides sp.]|uniref:DUF2490 domain-containing protein n=1 Tax=Bacteroides sp. TaxID=29523 RepID=UPI002610C9A3|nr:DUF2490 domain-containing protein [Bacteroides sp.]MDD3037501.1 DUF2490 domain-containing protein [Bacteroides sp.]